jgi:hypothetical protein
MAGELIAQFNAFQLNHESSAGFNAGYQLVSAGAYRGVSLQKLIQSQLMEYYSFCCVVPAAAALATGITVVLNIVDDTTSILDPGTVLDIGVTAQNLSASGALASFTTGVGAEQTGTVTLSSTSRNPVQISIAIANAQLSSLAVGNILGLRIRRVGDNVADTCQGRAILLSGMIKNT